MEGRSTFIGEENMFDTTVNELAKYVMQDHTHVLQRLKAKDIMSIRVETFHVNQPIFEVAKNLANTRTSGNPVIDSDGKLVGFLSEKDCLKHLYEQSVNSTPFGVVADYMTTDVECIQSDSYLYPIIENFISKPYQAYPVLEGNILVGIIRRPEVLQALLTKGVSL